MKNSWQEPVLAVPPLKIARAAADNSLRFARVTENRLKED